MPTIVDFGEFKVVIRFADHNPPHFHVVGPDVWVKVRIDDLSVVKGTLPAGALQCIRKWVEANPGLLEERWTEFCE